MSTATNETFSPWVHYEFTGQLTIGGSNVVSGPHIDSLVRTDWQGAITLSETSRTNYLPASTMATPGYFAGYNTTFNYVKGADGVSNSGGRVIVTADDTDCSAAQYLTVTANTQYVFRFWAKRGNLPYQTYRVFNDTGGSDIVVATSYYSQTNSSTWSLIEVPFTTPAGCVSVSVYVMSTPGGAVTAGQYTDASNPSVMLASAANKSHIMTTGAAESVVDYSYNSFGVVTLGETASGTYVWSGYGSLTWPPMDWHWSHPPLAIRPRATRRLMSGTAEVKGTTGEMFWPLSVATAYATGVSGTGAVGTATAVAGGGGTDATATPSGVSGTGTVGTPTSVGIRNATSTPSGVNGTGAVGTPTAVGIRNVSGTPSGVQGTGQTGTVTGSGAANRTPSGIQATGSVGTPTAVGISNVSGTPTGVFGTGAVGTPTGIGRAEAEPNGVFGTGQVGTPIASGGSGAVDATGLPSGVQGTGQTGSTTGSGASNVTPLGVSGTGQVGTPTASISKATIPTGVFGTGSVGNAVASGASNVSPLGVYGTGQVGNPTGSGAANVTPLGVFGTGQVGIPVAVGQGQADAVGYPSGVQGIGEVGTPTTDSLTDHQPIRIIYRKRKKKPVTHKPLVLDMDFTEAPVLEEVVSIIQKDEPSSPPITQKSSPYLLAKWLPKAQEIAVKRTVEKKKIQEVKTEILSQLDEDDYTAAIILLLLAS